MSNTTIVGIVGDFWNHDEVSSDMNIPDTFVVWESQESPEKMSRTVIALQNIAAALKDMANRTAQKS